MLKQKNKFVQPPESVIERDFLNIVDKWRPKPLLDVERAVIGILLFCVAGEWEQLLEELTLDDFYDDNCKRVFKTIQNLKRSGKIEFQNPLFNQVVNYNHEFTASDLVKYDGGNVFHAERYVVLLKQAAIARAYYTTVFLAPRFLRDASFNVDDFLDVYEEHTRPIFEAIAKQKESRRKFEELQQKVAQENFVPHFIVRGEEKYKVLQSKYEPYDGYVWIDNRGVKEDKLLKEGFEIVYE